MSALSRLHNPKSIAVIGGGAWCEAVIKRSQEANFQGPIWSIHPKRKNFLGLDCFASVSDLPEAPDAVFIGVNRHLTIDIVRALSDLGAGGAVCFASGFAETSDGNTLNQALLDAAGDMPILGPNCYGFLNYLDGAMLWPDIHGGGAVETGVAIIGQSSNIVLNLTMQRRGLPIAYCVAAGNQAQQGLADIAFTCLEDPRVTALGLHVEGFGDIPALERLARRAYQLQKPIICIKVGRSGEAQAASLSHTASMAGVDAGADALMKRLGILRARSLDVFLESLKLAHIFGTKLQNKKIASLSCSGGEASLMADLSHQYGLTFSPLNETQKKKLGEHLSHLVTLTNPLDYHTEIWRNKKVMTEVFATMTSDTIALSILVLDFPRHDRCTIDDWLITLEALEQAAEKTGKPFAVLASLSENLPEAISSRLLAQGIAPLAGMDAALEAVALMTDADIKPRSEPVLLGRKPDNLQTLNEDEAKAALSHYGMTVPNSARAKSAQEAANIAQALSFPLVVKGLGIAHKSDQNAVILNLQTPKAVYDAVETIPATTFLIEEMARETIIELLIGVTLDEAHGYLLTLGAGGIQTEILKDQQSLILPVTETILKRRLIALKSHRFFMAIAANQRQI